MTNREKLIEDLKSMPVDDLVMFLSSVGAMCNYCVHCNRDVCLGCEDTCVNGMKEYLEQEVDSND